SAHPEIYTLSLHDALPIFYSTMLIKIKRNTPACLYSFPEQLFAYLCQSQPLLFQRLDASDAFESRCSIKQKKTSRCMIGDLEERSEEHTSELQSPCNLVCR